MPPPVGRSDGLGNCQSLNRPIRFEDAHLGLRHRDIARSRIVVDGVGIGAGILVVNGDMLGAVAGHIVNIEIDIGSTGGIAAAGKVNMICIALYVRRPQMGI